MDNNEENEERRKIGGNSARRKKQLKNDQKIMNIIVPDGRNENGSAKKAEEVGHSSGTGSKGKNKPGYTGGRDRQLKERHKGEFRRRQADKKMRSGIF